MLATVLRTKVAEEVVNLRSQNVISSLRNEFAYGGVRHLPYALTEQEIMTLSRFY